MDIGEILANTVQCAEQNERLKINDGDYILDGLYYCGKCHTQKQARVEFGGHVWMPLCLCECESRRIAEEEANRKRLDRDITIARRRALAFPEAAMEHWTFGNDDGANARLTAIAKRYVDNFEDIASRPDLNGIVFYGAVGTGKTYISACIANALIDGGYTVKMTNFMRLENILFQRGNDKQEYIDTLMRYDLLVLDDLAAERDTDYMNEVVFSIIDARAVSKRPMIITTNLTAEQLKYPDNDKRARIYSRILERCVPVEVTGGDRRKDTLRRNYKSMTELLGI